MSNVRKTLADFAASIITAYESDLEDAERCFGEAETRAVTAEKELAAAQERLARRSHEPGALVAAVSAESRLVKENELADDRVKALEEALQNERINHNNTLVKLRTAQGKSLDVRSVVVEIEAERHRQKAKGWTEAHDDGHAVGELAWAAVHYAAPDLNRFDVDVWPFDSRPKLYGMGPTGRRRELIVAAALLVAEVERLDRANAKAKVSSFDRKPDGGSTFVGGPLSAPVIPGIPCQPPEDVARGVLDIERAEARDATGRAP